MTTYTAPNGTRIEENRMLSEGETVSGSFARQVRALLDKVNPKFMHSYLMIVGGTEGLTDDGPQNVAMIAGGDAKDVHKLWEVAHDPIVAMEAMRQSAEANEEAKASTAGLLDTLDEVPTAILETALRRRQAMDEEEASRIPFSLEDLAKRFGLRTVDIRDCGNPNCEIHGNGLAGGSLGAY